MTPKEKAEELVNKFIGIKPIKLSDYSKIYHPTAKQCALIAVEEIMSTIDAEDHVILYNYWQKVKNEIEKL